MDLLDGDYANELNSHLARMWMAVYGMRDAHPELAVPDDIDGKMPAFLMGLAPNLREEFLNRVHARGHVRTIKERFLDPASRQNVLGDHALLVELKRELEESPVKRRSLDRIAHVLNSTHDLRQMLWALRRGLVIMHHKPPFTLSVTG